MLLKFSFFYYFAHILLDQPYCWPVLGLDTQMGGVGVSPRDRGRPQGPRGAPEPPRGPPRPPYTPPIGGYRDPKMGVARYIAFLGRKKLIPEKYPIFRQKKPQNWHNFFRWGAKLALRGPQLAPGFR